MSPIFYALFQSTFPTHSIQIPQVTMNVSV